jgi:hypothetical protein
MRRTFVEDEARKMKELQNGTLLVNGDRTSIHFRVKTLRCT